jgi:hypothetical protein
LKVVRGVNVSQGQKFEIDGMGRRGRHREEAAARLAA